MGDVAHVFVFPLTENAQLQGSGCTHNSEQIVSRPAAVIYVIVETLLSRTFSRCFHPEGIRAGARLVQSKLKLCVTDIANGHAALCGFQIQMKHVNI